MTDSSANLKLARMRAGLTGKDLADRLGMLPNTYRQIESGRRKLKFELAVQVAEILRCDLNELLSNGEGLVPAETPSDMPALTSFLPVFGKSAIASNEVEFVDTGNKIPRPDIVASSSEAYALHVFNDRAGPRFEVGDLVILDPSVPVVRDQWCVIAIKSVTKTVAEIHRVKEVDVENNLVHLSDDGQLSLKACASIDVVVAIHPR